jgi:predicted membrane protein
MSSETEAQLAHMHWPSLAAAFAIMLAGTLYPPLFADSSGRVDHAFAATMFCAMSAGFVSGVGFVPQAFLWRHLFSGRACAIFIGFGLLVKGIH